MAAMSGLPPDVNRGPEMLRAIWIMDGIAAVVVALRLFTSGYVHRRVDWSDGFMVLALILGITNNAIITVSASWGLGRHIMYLSGPQIVNAMKYQTIAEPIGIMSPTLGRIAFALYLFKLVGPLPLKRWILHICIWATVIVNVLNIITIFAQCPHVPQIWEETPPGVCWPKTVQSDLGYFQGAVNTVVDLTLTILPAMLVWKLQMNVKLKAAVASLLGLSIFAAIASIVKTVELRSIGAGGDITYNLIPFVIWFTVENNVVIVAASIPAIRPLFGRHKAISSSNSAYGAYGMSGYGPKSHGYLKSQRSQFDTRGTETELTYIGADKDLSQETDRYNGVGIRKNTSIILTTRGIIPSEHSSDGHGGGADSDKESQVGLANAV